MLTGLIPLILGLGLIGFGIFIKIKDISFRKEAVPTKFLKYVGSEIDLLYVDYNIAEGY